MSDLYYTSDSWWEKIQLNHEGVSLIGYEFDNVKTNQVFYVWFHMGEFISASDILIAISLDDEVNPKYRHEFVLTKFIKEKTSLKWSTILEKVGDCYFDWDILEFEDEFVLVVDESIPPFST